MQPREVGSLRVLMNFNKKTPTSKNADALNMLADVHAMFVLICQK